MFDFKYRRKDSENYSSSSEKCKIVEEIFLDDIVPNPNQPRKIFNEEQLDELALSIKEYGVLQPVIVNGCKNGKYYLIAGERRFKASKMAGLKTIPAIVRDFEDMDSSVVALVENVQRENLNFIEEARAYRRLIEEFGLTQNDISAKVGKQQSTISNKIRILNLPEDIQKAVIENNLTERHARALLKLEEDEDRKNVLKRVMDNHLNVKQTEKIVDEVLTSRFEQRRREKTVGYISYKIYINTLKKAFTQVQKMEKNSTFIQEDKGDFMEVRITIPKNNRCFT